MLQLSDELWIPESDIQVSAIRASGPGGQNVNKVSTGIHLRFDIQASRLPESVKHRLLAYRDSRISSSGVIVIKAQSHRSQEKNREEALQRLRELVGQATAKRKTRRATRPTRASRRRRMDAKKRRGETKSLRQRPRL